MASKKSRSRQRKSKSKSKSPRRNRRRTNKKKRLSNGGKTAEKVAFNAAIALKENGERQVAEAKQPEELTEAQEEALVRQKAYDALSNINSIQSGKGKFGGLLKRLTSGGQVTVEQVKGAIAHIYGAGKNKKSKKSKQKGGAKPNRIDQSTLKTFDDYKKVPQISYWQRTEGETDGKKNTKRVGKPRFSGNAGVFQAMSQKYLGQFSFIDQLDKLVELQQTVPFMLTDPGQKKIKKGTKVKYGYADLFRFQGWPYTRGMAKNGNNPWYNPIQYPIPDVRGNRVFAKFLDSSPAKQYDEINTLIRAVESKGGVFKPNSTEYKTLYGMMFNLAAMLDPTFLSKFVPGQERPTEVYAMKDLDRKLAIMLGLHRIHEPPNYENPLAKVEWSSF